MPWSAMEQAPKQALTTFGRLTTRRTTSPAHDHQIREWPTRALAKDLSSYKAPQVPSWQLMAGHIGAPLMTS